MPEDQDHRATLLLQRLSRGDQSAAEELFEVLYPELHKLAAGQMLKLGSRHTLQPTGLVNEVYLRLIGRRAASFVGRKEFLVMASKVMRSVLVDHARRNLAIKRGGRFARVTLAANLRAKDEPILDVLALDEALTGLTKVDQQLSQIIELRLFGGLTCAEAAQVLDMPLRSLERSYRVASAWLHDRLTRGDRE